MSRVINHGTEYCAKCGTALFEFVEYELYNGELDSDITQRFCRDYDGLCPECYAAEQVDEEAEE